jgi:hypothetical protein
MADGAVAPGTLGVIGRGVGAEIERFAGDRVPERGDVDENRIAGKVAVAIVDALEVVDVDDRQLSARP